MSVADVEALLDENAEQAQKAKGEKHDFCCDCIKIYMRFQRLPPDLDEAISGHVLSAEDEAALEDEYNQLLESSALETGQELPSVPLTTPEAPATATTTTSAAGKVGAKKAVLVGE